ncbi:unnamed protein product [Discosporangium mesarthrocarpum]
MVTLDRVTYVPALQRNLFSLMMTAHKSVFRFATTTGVSIINRKLHLKSGDVPVAHTSHHFPVPVNPLGAVATLTPGHNPGTVIDFNLFHCAFGHAYQDALRKTVKWLAAAGVDITLVDKLHPCMRCALGKSLRRSIPKRTQNRAGERLAHVFVDLGKRTKSLGGAHYLMVVRDDYSRFSWVYLLKKKSEASEAFKAFMSEFHLTAEMTVWSDDGVEFLGGSFGALCRDF